MTPLAQNFTDQSGTIASNLAKGTREIRFAPGYHRLAKPIGIPHGTRFVGHKAVLDFAHSDWAFLLSGDFHLDGVELIHRDDVNPMLATGIAGDPHISFERVTCEIKTTIQNIKTTGATNSTFKAQSMWRNATVTNCTFTADTFIGGSTQFTNNHMRGRLIANAETGGLSKALVKRVRWDSWQRTHNAMEGLLFEDCPEVVDCEISELEFRGGCPTLFHWGVNLANSTCKCHRNVFRDITSDGPSAIGLRFIGGDVDANLIQNVSIHRAMYPILLEQGCKTNTLDMISIVDCVPSVMQGGWEPWNWDATTRKSKRYAIRDDGTDTRYGQIHAEGLRGIELCNRRERIINPIEN